MLCVLQLPVPRIVPDTYKVLLGRKEEKEGRRKGGRGAEREGGGINVKFFSYKLGV